MIPPVLNAWLDLQAGVIAGAPVIVRHLADLQGVFADAAAYRTELGRGNPLVYRVSSLELGIGQGDLHCALGLLMPGKVGQEYYLTRGHYHAWRAAAEIYLGLKGHGVMLLEQGDESRVVPLEPDAIVYVPGDTAHRTINTAEEPLVYLGIYPAAAGHDYRAVADRNFRKLIVEQQGRPVVLNRS
jgi:glucose-6-phosphate isomerase